MGRGLGDARRGAGVLGRRLARPGAAARASGAAAIRGRAVDHLAARARCRVDRHPKPPGDAGAIVPAVVGRSKARRLEMNASDARADVLTAVRRAIGASAGDRAADYPAIERGYAAAGTLDP